MTNCRDSLRALLGIKPMQTNVRRDWQDARDHHKNVVESITEFVHDVFAPLVRKDEDKQRTEVKNKAEDHRASFRPVHLA